MEKKGQVTIFIIIGIVIMVIIVLALFGRDLLLNPEGEEGISKRTLELQMGEVEKRIDRCIDEKVGEKIKVLGEQGGYFDSVDYFYYYGDKIAYLCKKIDPDKNCVNSILRKEGVSLRLQEVLGDSITRCLDFSDLRNQGDFEFETGEMNVSVQIEYDNVFVEVFYPVVLMSKSLVVDRDIFVREVDVPLGDMINVANDILRSEAVAGDFETLGYTLLHSSRYNIEKRNPYPDRMYIIHVLNNPYIFQFAIEGGSNG